MSIVKKGKVRQYPSNIISEKQLKDSISYPFVLNDDCMYDACKRSVPTCSIMGVKIAAVNMDWLIDFTHKNITAISGNYCCVSNVHTTVMAWENETYRAVQNGGILAIPDGGPLSSIGKKRGYKNMKRTTGPDYMEKIFESGIKKQYRHFFYGSTVETLKKMNKNITKKYPGICIAGMYSPPFRNITDEEDAEIVEMINRADPDFIWVGLGAPKQEIWMAEHKGKVRGFMVGVGAGFDYLAGNIKRAPEWMQNCNMEWLYRLVQDPGKLFKRYWCTNAKFIWHVLLKGE